MSHPRTIVDLLCTLLLSAPSAAWCDEVTPDDRAWQAYRRGEYALALQLHERAYAETKQPDRLAAIGQTKIKLGRTAEGLKDCLSFFNYVPNATPAQRSLVEGCIAEGRQAIATPASAGSTKLPRGAVAIQKWEQICVPAADEASNVKSVKHRYVHAVNLPNGWNKVLAAYGEQGWELVAVLQTFQGDEIAAACFKRPRASE